MSVRIDNGIFFLLVAGTIVGYAVWCVRNGKVHFRGVSSGWVRRDESPVMFPLVVLGVLVCAALFAWVGVDTLRGR
ncbi:MAG: hypothetical protein E7812_01340 [Phenylobacterium sp.]|nr:MAG: hypothetical protein E7812_01340 [Phenylobacterium sp.]